MTTIFKPTKDTPPEEMIEYAEALTKGGDDLTFVQKSAYYAEANYWMLRAIYKKESGKNE